MLTFRMIETWIKDKDTYNIHTGLILSIQSGTSHPDNFITFAIDLRLGISFSVKNVTDSPVLPARPILYINHAYHYHYHQNHYHHHHHRTIYFSLSPSSTSLSYLYTWKIVRRWENSENRILKKYIHHSWIINHEVKDFQL